jgi:hypothetical protein
VFDAALEEDLQRCPIYKVVIDNIEQHTAIGVEIPVFPGNRSIRGRIIELWRKRGEID